MMVLERGTRGAMDVDHVSRIKNRVLAGLVCIGLFFLCLMVYVVRLGPEARAARAFFREMPVDRIRAMVLEPIPRETKPLTTRTIFIRNPDQIRAIAIPARII